MVRKWFCLIALGFFSFDPPKLVKTKMADGITMLIPKGWRPMDALDFSERYPSVRAPLAAYTDYDRLVDVSVNVSATQWPDGNVEMAQRFFKSSIINAFDRVEILQEGVHEVNGRQFVFFEFESTVRGNVREQGQQESILKYSYVQYLILPRRTLVFSFHCPRRMRADWRETAAEIMGSIKVK